jgi:hypothetical protein
LSIREVSTSGMVNLFAAWCKFLTHYLSTRNGRHPFSSLHYLLVDFTTYVVLRIYTHLLDFWHISFDFRLLLLLVLSAEIIKCQLNSQVVPVGRHPWQSFVNTKFWLSLAYIACTYINNQLFIQSNPSPPQKIHFWYIHTLITTCFGCIEPFSSEIKITLNDINSHITNWHAQISKKYTTAKLEWRPTNFIITLTFNLKT